MLVSPRYNLFAQGRCLKLSVVIYVSTLQSVLSLHITLRYSCTGLEIYRDQMYHEGTDNSYLESERSKAEQIDAVQFGDLRQFSTTA